MDWIYTRQLLLNLRNLRYITVLDYKIKQRIKCLKIKKKYRSKRGNGRDSYGAKSLHRPWDKNSGIHWDVLKSIPVTLQFILPRYLSALLNVRSLSSNLLQIQHFLESSSLDILALTETWTKQNQSLETIQGTLSTMGHSLVSSHRPGRTGGGLGLTHKDIIGVKKKDAGISQTFEHLILELENKSIFAIIYCPPNSSISTFLDEFTDWISHLLNKYVDPLILGDLNVNLQKPDMPNSAAFLECLETYALRQRVLDPTHQSGSLLDHVMTRENSTVLLDKPKVLDLISDHRLICLGISKHQPLSKPTIIKFRKLNDIPTQVIQQEISDMFELCHESKNPNTYLEIANKAWLTALDKMAPEKESRKKDCNRLPWFNADALAQKWLKRADGS